MSSDRLVPVLGGGQWPDVKVQFTARRGLASCLVSSECGLGIIGSLFVCLLPVVVRFGWRRQVGDVILSLLGVDRTSLDSTSGAPTRSNYTTPASRAR